MTIGAGVFFSDLTADQRLQEHYPLLITACNTIGSLQLRNRATLGGNIVNAAPCADSVPPLIIYDAIVVLQIQQAQRRMPLSDFITAGYRTRLQPGELLTAVILPAPYRDPGLEQRYLQLGRRNALNITRQSFTGQFTFNHAGMLVRCRLVDGALLSKPQRLIAVEKVLTGQALTVAQIEAGASALEALLMAAIGNRWSAAYKVPVALDMLRQMLQEAREAGTK